MPDPRKIEIVADTAARMKAASAIYFTDFKGLSAPQATDLRAQLRAQNIDLIVVKKTLIRLAAAEAGLSDIEEFLTGQMAMAFVKEEPTAPAKVLDKFSKAHENVPTITGIILEGEYLSGTSVGELASLPSKQVLVAQLASTLKQPLTALVGTLNGAMSKLARTLASLGDKKNS